MNIQSGWLSAITIAIIASLITYLSSISIGGKQIITINKKIGKTEKSFIKSLFFTYFIWGTVQQGLLIGLYELINIPGNQYVIIWGSMIAAGLFGAIHYPNIILMYATYGMGQTLILHWSIYHNILAIGFAHGAMGSVLMYYLPKTVDGNMNTKIGQIVRDLKITAKINKYIDKLKAKTYNLFKR